MKIVGFFTKTATLVMVWLITSTPAQAMLVNAAQAQRTQTIGLKQQVIIKAFDPIIELFQGVAFPLCFLAISIGCLMLMLGHRAKGLDMIKWAAIGYLFMQFIPAIMRILVDVGAAMRAQ
jgi:hypothetical protein